MLLESIVEEEFTTIAIPREEVQLAITVQETDDDVSFEVFHVLLSRFFVNIRSFQEGYYYLPLRATCQWQFILAQNNVL